MALALEGVAFIVSYRCNLSCPHCFFDGSLSRQSLEPRVIDEALRSLDRPLRWIHFTGGEPFLDVNQLMRLLEGPVGLYRMAGARGRAPVQGPFRDECDLCFHSRRALRRDFPAVLLPDECYPAP